MDKKTLGLICLIMSVIALLLFFGPFITVLSKSISGFELAFDIFGAIKSYIDNGEEYAGILARVFALIALFETAGCIIESISLIKESLRNSKIIAYGQLITGVIVLILDLSIPSVSEYDVVADLGIGAIASGGLILITSVILCISALKNNDDEVYPKRILNTNVNSNTNNNNHIRDDNAINSEQKTHDYCDICNRKTEKLYHVIHTSDKLAEAEKYVCNECLQEYNCTLIEEQKNDKSNKTQGGYLGGWIVCPGCAKLQQASNSFCGHCGKRLSSLDEAYVDESNPEEGIIMPNKLINDWVSCPNCGKLQKAGKSVCWSCGMSFTENSKEDIT